MPSPTNEKALEMAIEKALTGTCLEELAAAAGQLTAQEPRAIYGAGGTYHIGDASQYNPKYAIDELRFSH